VTTKDALISYLRENIPKDIKRFLSLVYEEHSKLNVVLLDYEHFPHCIHFKEGMLIRNLMRESGMCDNFTATDLDNTWEEITIRALKLN